MTPNSERTHPMKNVPHEIKHDENRRNLWKLKQAHKTIGIQGQTIHIQRCKIAELHDLTSKIDRAEIRRLERQLADVQRIREAQDKKINLQEDRIKELEAEAAQTDADLEELADRL